jgi:hypothetical protein
MDDRLLTGTLATFFVGMRAVDITTPTMREYTARPDAPCRTCRSLAALRSLHGAAPNEKTLMVCEPSLRSKV